MYIHAAHFKILPDQVSAYRKDCKLWAKYAKSYKGFIACHTVKRVDIKNEYASIYVWETKRHCDKFMNELHDNLVGKSYAKVKTLNYFRFDTIYSLKA